MSAPTHRSQVGSETCQIAVMILRTAARSYKVSGGHMGFGGRFQASAADELYTIPVSQISQIIDLGGGRHVIEIPRWLAKKEGLLKHFWAG